MTATTHRLGGIALGFMAASLVDAESIETALMIGGAVVGSLLPDIDNPKSCISHKLRIISIVITIGQSIIRGISHLLPRKYGNYVRSLIGHRGLTHSFVPIVAISVAAVVISLGSYGCRYQEYIFYIAIGLNVGIFSHILLDIFSGGAPIRMPFTTKRTCLAEIKTGGKVECLFRLVLTITFLYLGMETRLWQRLLHL